jgi:hypothetical protein
MTLDEAISTAKQHVKDPFALAYLESIPDAIEEGGNSLTSNAIESLQLQITYILSNMRTWRGPLARETKQVMRDFVKKRQDENQL